MTPLRPFIAAVTTALISIALFACQKGGNTASHPPPALSIAALSPTAPPSSITESPATPSLQPKSTPRAGLSNVTPTIDVGKELEAGHLYRRNGDYARAVSQYKSIISALPNSIEAKEARYWLGRTYLLDNQYELAAQTFQAFLQNYPDDEHRDRIIFLLGTCETELGHWQKAIEYYQMYASKSTVARDYVNLRMADIYMGTKEFLRAIELYGTALRDDTPRGYSQGLWEESPKATVPSTTMRRPFTITASC